MPGESGRGAGPPHTDRSDDLVTSETVETTKSGTRSANGQVRPRRSHIEASPASLAPRISASGCHRPSNPREVRRIDGPPPQRLPWRAYEPRPQTRMHTASTTSATPMSLFRALGWALRLEPRTFKAEARKLGDHRNTGLITPVAAWVIGVISAYQIFDRVREPKEGLHGSEEVVAVRGPIVIFLDEPTYSRLVHACLAVEQRRPTREGRLAVGKRIVEVEDDQSFATGRALPASLPSTPQLQQRRCRAASYQPA